ncbi:uncharacterized protein VDAG_04112 [Verticillium dahliae VdLs.17]|uniref:Fibroin-3 n=1 Tax=Verticillium dahliae (strain VdLs.17 / ATCC MYA-4575 / FGSC 10137) TaxID=498257 RepID=G2X2R8_VERDV|nr:uncharacterized protein VDAG_04112 [Verticillium dahliae VdLs.17]EGY22674.1 hypothetical protein VDAG_04112 [Verticillium dahliae VdLs.17]
MPNVDVAMARSLRGGWWGSITAGIAENLQQRQVTDAVNNVGNTVNDVTNTVTDIRTALSSWDNCMSVSWCKWPVITVIIVGGLIIFSIVWCVIRCMCCGLSCCCTCFSCLKCCGNCCGCCDAPGDKKHKYLDESYGAHALPPGQGYKSQPAMFASAIPVSNPEMTPSHGVTTASPPQYAEFDVSKKRLSDALPAMPTWESAGSKRISLEQEAVEMDTMKKPVAAQSMNNLQSNPTIPLMATGAMSPHLPSPNTPYGQAQGGFGGQAVSCTAGVRRSPGPQSDSGYARPQYSQDRQYSDASRPLAGPSSPAHQQGFDFGGSGGGYGGRPQQQQQQSYGYDDDQHHQQQHDQRPPKSSGSEIAYPGFRAYQPAQQGWSGV